MFNQMSCSGFDTGIMGGCSQVWFTFALVLFLCMIIRRQTIDGILGGTKFSFIGSLLLGLGLNVLLTTLFGDARWSLLGGLGGIIIGGFVLGRFIDGGENG